MVGAGRFLDSSKASTKNSLLHGLVLAVAFHIALLAIKPKFFGFSKDRPRPLLVSIQLVETKIDSSSPDVLVPEPPRETPKQLEAMDDLPQIIVVEATPDEPNSERKPRIQISTRGENFKRFLQSETNRNIKTKQDKLSEFSTTFQPLFEAPQNSPEISYRDFQGVLGGGQYKVYKNGKVTCVLNMVSLSFDDHVYGAGGGARDCTPKSKFVLNLRENTREQ